MQLSGPRKTRLPFIVVVVAALTGGSSAHAEEPAADEHASTSGPANGTENAPAKAGHPEDTSVKRATFEMASYTDSDHITVVTPSISASVENVTAGASLRGSYLVDVVSAASIDIVSTASRRWTEVRKAGALEAEYKPHDFGISIAGSASSEPDYFSYGFGAQMTKDFDEKNTTLLFGYGFGHDTIGRSTTPFAVFSREVQRGTFNGALTQVINRSTVASLAMDLTFETGDQSKPYRYIPMFAPGVASKVPVGASIEFVTANRLPERPLEQLPLSRRRFSMSGRLAHRFDDSTLRLDERIYDDSWGLLGSSTDARWIFDLGRRFAIWPHGRFHIQSPVSFWQRAYTSGSATGWNLPEFRTGDRELGPLHTFTFGGGIKWFLGSNADPQTFAISLTGDGMWTSYHDDLYLTSRTAILGALMVEGEL